MRNFQARRQMRKAVYSVPSLVLLLVLCFFSFRSVWGVYQKYALTEQLLSETEAAHEKLSSRTGELETATARLATDRGVEEEVRNHFQVARPGEDVVILVDEATTTATSTPPKPWWHFW